MKQSIVLGLGNSGLAAAKWLLKQGHSVIGIDRSVDAGSLAQKYQMPGLTAQSEHAFIHWTEVQQLIVSSGISLQHPLCVAARENGVLVKGEAELALPHFTPRLIGVTGTNGKTTVTLLVAHILNHAGIRAQAVGNVGFALCDYLLTDREEKVCVVELSSYQLETLQTPVFELGALLNITPDHLDRYPSMLEYVQAKCVLERLIKPKGAFFANKQVAKVEGHSLRQPQWIGWDESCSIWIDHLEIRDEKGCCCHLPASYAQAGSHDYENLLAAWALCRYFGVTEDVFVEGLTTFVKPSHRVQWVGEVRGVHYYDDSKGTNIDAVIQAVKTMPSSTILIAGGVDKGSSYEPWLHAFQNKVKHIIVLGQAAPKIAQMLEGCFPISSVSSLQEAVALGEKLAHPGDCVLLSPGCASYDMFRDYIHRGQEFQNCVKKITSKEKR